jgi:hypothetical protein
MVQRFFLAAAFVIFCAPSLVSACTCGGWFGGCNQAWKFGEVIFTGKVTSKITDSAPATLEDHFLRNAFQFSVDESFRGSAIAGQEITIYTGMGGGDCGYEFNVGTTYLVYAAVYNGKLITGICTPTNLAARVPDVIRQLRALQKGERVADLFGTLGTAPVSLADDPLDIKPLAGKRVRVIGVRNLTRSTTTDNEGVYSFPSLPADTYRIEIDPPTGMSTWQLNQGETYKAEIGAQAGCPVSITFGVDGRIKGRAVDEQGNGVAGFVTVEFVDQKEAEIARRRGGGMGITTESGEFRLWMLRPTRYRLVFRRKVNGKTDFRVPPVKSEVITLGMGQHIEDFLLKVPAVRP